MLLIINGKPKSEAIKALDRNNEAQAGAGKANGKAGEEAANGNSAFGHKQGDAATRTTGSQNNAHGKAESADAHALHAKKATLHNGDTAHTKSKSHASEMATVHHTSQHPQVVSHQPQGRADSHQGASRAAQQEEKARERRPRRRALGSPEPEQEPAVSGQLPARREIRRIEDLQAALAHFTALLHDLKP